MSATASIASGAIANGAQLRSRKLLQPLEQAAVHEEAVGSVLQQVSGAGDRAGRSQEGQAQRAGTPYRVLAHDRAPRHTTAEVLNATLSLRGSP